jgi:hypothetical protein
MYDSYEVKNRLDMCHAGTSSSDLGKHENHYLADHGPRVTTIFHARHRLPSPKWTGHVIKSHRERSPKLSSSLTAKYVPDGLGRLFSPPSTLFLESRVYCRRYVTSCDKWTCPRAKNSAPSLRGITLLIWINVCYRNGLRWYATSMRHNHAA